MHTFDPNEIVAMERAALDRWGAGDPLGYLEIMAADVTYFDPSQDRRLDGLRAMTELLVPLTGKIKVDRYDMVDPRVQQYGNAAILTFNLVSYRRSADGTERAIAHWNSTEAYARVDGRWRIVHSHWSFVRPELKQPSRIRARRSLPIRGPPWSRGLRRSAMCRCTTKSMAPDGRDAPGPGHECRGARSGDSRLHHASK